MKREDYIKSLIQQKGYNLKEFAALIDLPYTTLLSMLKSIGGAGIDNVIKVCKGLNITINDLSQYKSNDQIKLELTTHETKVINAYRAQPQMQTAVDRILNIEVDNNNDGIDILDDMVQMVKAVSQPTKAKAK